MSKLKEKIRLIYESFNKRPSKEDFLHAAIDADIDFFVDLLETLPKHLIIKIHAQYMSDFWTEDYANNLFGYKFFIEDFLCKDINIKEYSWLVDFINDIYSYDEYTDSLEEIEDNQCFYTLFRII